VLAVWYIRSHIRALGKAARVDIRCSDRQGYTEAGPLHRCGLLPNQ